MPHLQVPLRQAVRWPIPQVPLAAGHRQQDFGHQGEVASMPEVEGKGILGHSLKPAPGITIEAVWSDTDREVVEATLGAFNSPVRMYWMMPWRPLSWLGRFCPIWWETSGLVTLDGVEDATTVVLKPQDGFVQAWCLRLFGRTVLRWGKR